MERKNWTAVWAGRCIRRLWRFWKSVWLPQDDTLKMIPTTKKHYIRFASGRISPEEMRKEHTAASENHWWVSLQRTCLVQPGSSTRVWSCMKKPLMPTSMPPLRKNLIMPTAIWVMPISGCANTKKAIEALEKVNEASQTGGCHLWSAGLLLWKTEKTMHRQDTIITAKHHIAVWWQSACIIKFFVRIIKKGNGRVVWKQLESALKIHRMQPEYNLVAGECKMQLGLFKDAVQYLTNVVSARPKNAAGWEALVRCLYNGQFYEDALEQTDTAIRTTHNKPLFYKAAIPDRWRENKEGILQLEKQWRKRQGNSGKWWSWILPFAEPTLVDVIARYKKKINQSEHICLLISQDYYGDSSLFCGHSWL